MPPATRLRALSAQLRQAPAAAAAAEPVLPAPAPTAPAPTEELNLLDDAAVQDYIRTGVHVLPLEQELGADYHADVNEKIISLAGGNMFQFGANNIYPAVPELVGVLQAPSVRGALTSVLGKDYVMHAHRALHLYQDMGSDQGFHQVTVHWARLPPR